MGIFDQEIWLLSRFKDPFDTVRGLNMWGNHVNPNVLLLVPFYWLGARPALPVSRRDPGAGPRARSRSGCWPGRLANAVGWRSAPAGAYLLYPSLEWINWWHFHPEALAITPLLFAWWFAHDRHWWWFARLRASSSLCVQGGRRARGDRHGRRSSRIKLNSGPAWPPRRRPPRSGMARRLHPGDHPGLRRRSGRRSTRTRSRRSATSLPPVVCNVVRHPSRVYNVMAVKDRHRYYSRCCAPVAWLALLDPVGLLCRPAAGGQRRLQHRLHAQISYHYSALVVAGIFMAVVETLDGSRRLGHRCAALVGGPAGLAALAANVAWSPSPIAWTTTRASGRARPRPCPGRDRGRAPGARRGRGQRQLHDGGPPHPPGPHLRVAEPLPHRELGDRRPAPRSHPATSTTWSWTPASTPTSAAAPPGPRWPGWRRSGRSSRRAHLVAQRVGPAG